jgi:hypothetical protein
MKNSYKNLTIFVIVCFFFSYAASAQVVDSAKANELQGKLIETICNCISQKDASSIKTAADAQNLIMNCFTGGGDELNLLIENYAKASGVDISNSDQLNAMSEKLGLELYLNCPAMMKMMANMAKDSTEYNKLTHDSTKP